MNFQNFCISIFKIKITAKKFLKIFFAAFITILSISLSLNICDFNINGNDTIRQYQLSKIHNDSFNKTSTIIIGDSSAGNAIDAKYFTELSGLNSKNLSLTGSWGLIGSTGILKNAYHFNKNIKNVIIIQTLDIWQRPFAKESILELYPINQAYQTLGFKSLIAYFLNPKEILWHIDFLQKKIFNSKINYKIDKKNDYIVQKRKKYSNGLKIVDATATLNGIKVSKDKIKELNTLQNFCLKNKLNCIFLNGPIHNQISKNSIKYLNYFNTTIKSKIKIPYIDTIFSYENNIIGDSQDHIDPDYKKLTTKEYYQSVQKHLIRK